MDEQGLRDFEDKAKAAFEKIEDKARQMGLYADSVTAVLVPPHGEMALVVDFIVGDVAFSSRVQNPQKAATDAVVNSMEKSMQTDNFLTERERIQKALAEGKDPLGILDNDDQELGN